MKKLTLLIILMLSCAIKSNGQSVFPSFSDSPTWNVLECHWFNCTTLTYQYTYDTLFCNQSYSKADLPFNQQGYIRSSNLKTYFRKSTDCNDKEYLLYDYSINVGDTTYVGFNLELGNQNDTSAFILSQIDTVNYFGIDRQRFTMNFDRCNAGNVQDIMYWIKGIGSDKHPFYSFRCLCDFCENNFTLLCYDSTANPLYMNSVFNTCDTTISVGLIEAPYQNEVNISPNPFTLQTKIQAGNTQVLHLKVFNTKGQLVQEVCGGPEIYFGDDLISGIYFTEVQTDKMKFIVKMVKL